MKGFNLSPDTPIQRVPLNPQRLALAQFSIPKHLPIIQRFPFTLGVPCAYLKQKNLGSTRKPFSLS
jgi:hypothetical protein